jgi:predicted metal-dependent hydrolase
MNHSAKFWAQVERVIPDWKQRRKWLKDNGNSLISRLPG